MTAMTAHIKSRDSEQLVLESSAHSVWTEIYILIAAAAVAAVGCWERSWSIRHAGRQVDVPDLMITLRCFADRQTAAGGSHSSLVSAIYTSRVTC